MMMSMTDLKHPVELFISCRGLKAKDMLGKSDPKVKITMKKNDQWVLVGETETIKQNLNPDFKTTIVVDFIFEIVQPIRFDIYDIDAVGRNDYLGQAETTLGEILGHEKQTLSLAVYLRGNIEGTLIVRGDKNESPHNMIYWQWSALNIMNLAGCFGKSSPFLKFFKTKGDGWFEVHDTEVLKQNLNPIWQMFKINDDKLCNSIHNQPIKVECWAHDINGKHKLIGGCEFTLDQIKNGENSFSLRNVTKLKPTGTLKLMNFALKERSSFIDFIRGGEQLHSIVAIDFTASNGDPKTEGTLHARPANGQLNEYQQAISNVCTILQYYDRSKLIPVYGFGAKPKYENLRSVKVSHCFPCSGDINKSEVVGVQGIMDIYNYALDNVELQGPTHFAPIISEAMKVCQVHKQNDSDIYTIFLIITDGEIHDIKETVDLLVEAAFLPMSIIMVGLGPANFSKMEIFEAGKELSGSNGKVVGRSLVQFVPFRNFKNDMRELAKSVLAQIPEQLVDYKSLVDKKPKPPVPHTMNGF